MVSKIWKEIKTPKSGSGFKKYQENPIEYQYDNIKQLQERLYYLYAQEKAGNDNFHNEKMGVINFIIRQSEKHADSPKDTKYILRLITVYQKGFLRLTIIIIIQYSV